MSNTFIEINNNDVLLKPEQKLEESKNSTENYPNNKRNIKMQLLILFCGLFFAFGAFKAVLCLQSSINIQGSVGAISGTVIYLSAALIALLFTPTIISYIGAKNGLVLSEIGYLLFIIGNLYPALPVMIFASLCGGVAEATIWPSINLLCAHLAAEYSSSTGKSEQKYLARIFGQFYFLIFSTMIFGNMISFGVLKLTTHNHDDDDVIMIGSFINGTNETMLTLKTDICGSHDCQDPNVTASIIDHYVPSAKTTVYILLSVFISLNVFAILLHHKFLTLVPTCSNKINKMSREKKKILSQFDSLHRTFKQIINPLQILVSPLSFYAGIKSAFMISEYLRAYGACISGVENVGLMMAVFGFGGCAASFLIKKIHTSLAMNLVMIFILVADICTYVVCLTVEFDASNAWICHLFSCVQGITMGLVFPLTSLFVPRYFHKKQHEVGYAVWNLFIVAGCMAEFGLSTQMCMEMKLFLHIGMVTFSALLYGIAEFIHQPRQNLLHKGNKFRKVSSSATVKSQEM